MRALALSVLATCALACVLFAQSPMPVIVQAAAPVATSSRAPVTSENSGSIQAALKMLQEMKAANEETLRKQTAALQQLDDLEKAAEQIRVFSKRG